MLPPGPSTPAFWQTFRFASAPRDYSRALAARHGLVTTFHALNGRGVAVSDPELVREVFAMDPDRFESIRVLGDLFGTYSVLATSGAVHRRQRKLLNPRFHGARVRAFLATMQKVVAEHVDAFRGAAEDGRVVVMTDLAQALTLDVILETVFGASREMDRSKARAILKAGMAALAPEFVFARPLRSPFYPRWRTFLQRRAEFDAWVDGLIAARRSAESLGEDLLGVLLEARYEDGSPMTDAEIRDLVMTLLLAGHETTAVALAWAVYWLLRTPETLERLRADLAALGPAPSPEAITRLPFLEAVVAETLRIEPVVSDVTRVCREPTTIGPWTVPAGQIVIVNMAFILSDEKLFPEPDRFRPERFLEKTFSAWQFLPFGGGARRCLGAAFAESEMALAVAAVASRWDLALADAAPERAVRRNITMGPKRGVRVRVVGPRGGEPKGLGGLPGNPPASPSAP